MTSLRQAKSQKFQYTPVHRWERLLKIWNQDCDMCRYMYRYNPLDNRHGFWYIDRQHQKSCSYIIWSWVTYHCENMQHFHCRIIIDNVGDYLYLKNGRFKFEVDPHHFNAKWLTVNHVGIYGSKKAQGCSAFQGQSCMNFDNQYIQYAMDIYFTN